MRRLMWPRKEIIRNSSNDKFDFQIGWWQLLTLWMDDTFGLWTTVMHEQQDEVKLFFVFNLHFISLKVSSEANYHQQAQISEILLLFNSFFFFLLGVSRDKQNLFMCIFSCFSFLYFLELEHFESTRKIMKLRKFVLLEIQARLRVERDKNVNENCFSSSDRLTKGLMLSWRPKTTLSPYLIHRPREKIVKFIILEES